MKKRQITAREYIELLEQQRDPQVRQINKFRQCFIFDSQYFQVDTFINVDGQPSLLRIDTTLEQNEINIPPFVKVIREVTDEDEYATFRMARNDYKMSKNDMQAVTMKPASKEKKPLGSPKPVPSAVRQIPELEERQQAPSPDSPRLA